MPGRQATVVAILGIILAACSVGGQPTASMRGSAAPTGGPTALAVVSPTPTTPGETPTPVATAVATPVPTVAATPTATPKPTAKATSARVPPKPTGVKFKARERCLSESCHRYKFTQTVTWASPLAKGVEVRVYGVTECLALPARPKPGSDGPCLVRGTPVPASVRTLLATAPASAGKATWTWIGEGWGCDIWYPVGSAPDGRDYYAIVVAAYSAAGHSIFAIAEPGEWTNPDFGPGDMPC